jgi:hypothetical protein
LKSPRPCSWKRARRTSPSCMRSRTSACRSS